MPYISKELRPRFDPIIKMVDEDRDGARYLLLQEIKHLYPSQVSSCLNYVFTQLLRRSNWCDDYKYFIRVVIQDVFCTPPKYYKLEAALGMLNAMFDEFERREWNSEGVIALEDLIDDFKIGIYRPYEDAARAKNGDLEVIE